MVAEVKLPLVHHTNKPQQTYGKAKWTYIIYIYIYIYNNKQCLYMYVCPANSLGDSELNKSFTNDTLPLATQSFCKSVNDVSCITNLSP